LEVLLELAGDLETASRQAFLEGTAMRTYGLQEPAPRAESASTTKQEGVKA
jgi:nucleoid-associated protein YejK